MATFTKPAKTPRWADTGVIVEPAEAKKDAGWIFEEIPASSFENWKENLNGEWWKWIDERWADGPSADVIALSDPSGANADPIVEMDGITALRTNFIFRDGGTNSTLRVTKDTQLLQWLNGAVQAFSADTSKLVVGPSDSDGIRLAGAGASKAITFDEDLNQVRYNITTDVMSFLCDSATSSLDVHKTHVSVIDGLNVGVGVTVPGAGDGILSGGLVVGYDGVAADDQIRIGDASFRITNSGANPTIDFDGVVDRLEYDRTANDFIFYIGGTNVMRIESSSLHPDSDILYDLGTASQSFRAIYSLRNVPEGPSYTVPVISRFERNFHNSITMMARISAVGFIYGNHWNVLSVDVTVTGTVRVLPDEDLGVNGHIVCSLDTFGFPVDVCQGQYEATILDEVQIRIMTVGAALVARNVSFIAFN